MNKKTFLLIALLLLVAIVAITLFFKTRNDTSGTLTEIDATPHETVLLKQAFLKNTDDALSVTGDAVEFLTPSTGMDEAAIEDGLCTEEDVINATCLNELYYLREKGEKQSIPLSKNIIIAIIDYERKEFDANKTIEYSKDEFIKSGKELPFLIMAKVLNGSATKIEEVYLP